MNTEMLPTYFISHGGGPWSYMEGEFRKHFVQLEAALKAMPKELGSRPKAVLVISGHWEAPEFTVMGNPAPPMVYDYSGFPEETYHIHYRAPGEPELAARIQALLEAAGLPNARDDQQGYDHGTFVPLSVIYPEADVPVVQLSLRHDCDPAAHIAAGRALAPLREEGVLIIGSGLTYHNLRQFGPAAGEPSRAFDDWLQQTLCHSTPEQRVRELEHWEQAPAARQAHPHEDHLLPLMVAVGAAYEEPGECVYHEEGFFGGLSVSNFRFG
jgi:aromatic ring-opening dioxygenase catalytic subunit (LigB family)